MAGGKAERYELYGEKLAIHSQVVFAFFLWPSNSTSRNSSQIYGYWKSKKEHIHRAILCGAILSIKRFKQVSMNEK